MFGSAHMFGTIDPSEVLAGHAITSTVKPPGAVK